MLRHICQRGRFLALINGLSHSLNANRELPEGSRRANALVQYVLRLLGQHISQPETSIPNPLHPPSTNLTLSPITAAEYNCILAYLNQQPRPSPIRHYAAYPHPLDSIVLYSSAKRIDLLTYKTRNYTTFKSHQGNSSITFTNPQTGTMSTGFIQSIWHIAIPSLGQPYTELLVVGRHTPLNNADESRNIYTAMPHLRVHVVYDHPSFLGVPVPYQALTVITRDAILNHLPFYRRPEGAFGISRGVIIMINTLGRLRLQ